MDKLECVGFFGNCDNCKEEANLKTISEEYFTSIESYSRLSRYKAVCID